MKWKTIKIGDCCTKIGSGSTPKGGSSVYKEDGVSFIRSQNVHNLEFDYDGLAHIDEKTAKKLNNVSIEENDVLLNITGDSVARTCVVPRNILPARVNQHVSIIRTKRQVINPLYLNFYLASPSMQSYMLGLAFGKGSSRNALTKQIIENFEISCPPIKIQESIASILSHYDDLIEINKRRIALLEESARELYKEWFVRMRFPGWEDIKIEKGVPYDWDYKELKQFGKIVTGKTPSTDNQDNFGGDIPFIKTPDMHDCIFLLDTQETLSEKGANSQKKCLLPPLSVCISCIGTVGVVGITTTYSQTNQQINSIIPSNKCYSYYLYFACESLKSTIEMYGANGATMTNLNKSKFGKLKLLCPKDDSLFIRFDQKVSPLMSVILNLQKQNKKLSLQRDRLLPRLMSGQLEV